MRGADRIPLIIIAGPTAAGKSELAVAAAEWFGGEVVSADAFQIYRGLDIGTAKVSAAVRARVPHHCLDIADPDEVYSAGRYAREAAAAIADIHRRALVPVVAGGSGFYLKALVEGLAPLPVRDENWRAALEAVAGRRGEGHMHSMLQVLDPEWAEMIGPADRQRRLRGLEVTLRSGVPMSDLLRRHERAGPPYDPTWVAVTRPREQLFERIERRVDAMLAAGWASEVAALLEAGYAADAPGLRAIGYRELVAHLRAETTLDEARDQIVRATRRYAKRQMTWFRGQTPAEWFELESSAEGTAYREVRRHLREKLTC